MSLSASSRRKVTQSFGKSLLIPGAKRFSDLFEAHASYEHDNKLLPIRPEGFEDTPIHTQYVEGHMITSYCIVSGGEHQSLFVRPRRSVIAAIENSTIALEYDHMYFEIIAYKDGAPALVVIKYGKIIGDRWLARIDASTIPNLKESK